MLLTVAIVCALLWVLGSITANTLGGFIHVLIILAVTLLLVRVVKGPSLKTPVQKKTGPASG